MPGIQIFPCVKAGCTVHNITDIFHDKETVKKIQAKLPCLFQLAEMESQRAGKVGMEVGTLRERILVALLIYKFGESNVETNLPITQSETDTGVFGEPISIKTKSGKGFSGVKLSWTVDRAKVLDFKDSYKPSCSMLFAHIVWEQEGGLYYISKETQQQVMQELGSDNYIKLPRESTNPRGVEITQTALQSLIGHNNTFKIDISWVRSIINFNPYKRWTEHWQQS